MSTKQVNHGGQLVVFVVRSFFDTKRLVLHPSYVYTFGEQNALLYFPEAAYLYYEDGGYYNWHMDTPSRERSLDPPKEEEMTKKQTEKAGRTTWSLHRPMPLQTTKVKRETPKRKKKKRKERKRKSQEV